MEEHRTIGTHICRRCSRKIKPGTVVKVEGKLNDDGCYVHQYECLKCKLDGNIVTRSSMDLVYLGGVG